MSIIYKEISSKESLEDFVNFYCDFHKGNDSYEIQDIRGKCLFGSDFQVFGALAYDESNNVIGALACYPFSFSNYRIEYKAGQIGDAMIIKDYLDKGVLDKLITYIVSQTKERDIKFIVAFPLFQNYGTHKTFVNNGFNQVGSIPMFLFNVSEGFLSRFTRRFIPSFFENRWRKELKKKVHSFIPSTGKYLSKRNKHFNELKSYSKYISVDFPSGNAILTSRKQTLIVGDFFVRDGETFDNLLLDIKRVAKSMGKIQIKIVTNVPHEYKCIRDVGYFEQNRNISIMIFYSDKTLDPLFYFNYSDLNTF